MASLAMKAWWHRLAGAGKRAWGRLRGDGLLVVEGDEEARLGRLEQRLARTLRRKSR